MSRHFLAFTRLQCFVGDWKFRAAFRFPAFRDEKNLQMRIRHVIVPNITDNREELFKLGQFLKPFRNIEKIETLPYHTLGKVKYDNLGLAYPLGDTPQLSESDAEKALEIIREGMQ